MSITGYQCASPGHIGKECLDNTAYFTAHSETDPDPTATLYTSIDNDTGYDWTAYDVNVYMTKPFTLSSPAVFADGWSVGSYDSTATLEDGRYEASVHFVGGTPVPTGTGTDNETDPGTLDFSYKLSLTGSVNYCQEMIPIPEPGTLALVLVGLAGSLVTRHKFAR